ncbi:hypothetical protein HMPREF9137_0811 [Prevotella denticola F0289]|nr:hypothetical protein HMPREF9137_0811 [Prevotella denticola F0289]
MKGGETKRKGRYKNKEQKQKGCIGYAAIGISGTLLIVFRHCSRYCPANHLPAVSA